MCRDRAAISAAHRATRAVDPCAYEGVRQVASGRPGGPEGTGALSLTYDPDVRRIVKRRGRLRGRVRVRGDARARNGRAVGRTVTTGPARPSRPPGPGAGLVELRQAGDWKAPKMPGHYARRQLAARGAVSKIRYDVGQ